MTVADAALGDSAAAFAPASRTAVLALPGRAVASSTRVGWTSLLLEARVREGAAVPAELEGESPPTPDQTLAVSLSGEVQLSVLRNGVWRPAVRQAGSAGLTPGGVTDRLRRRSRGPDPIRTAHVYLPMAVFHDAVEHFRQAGAPHRAEPLNALAFRDPLVTHAVLALVRAVEAGAPDLYAATVAQSLAIHLLARHSGWEAWTDDRRNPGPIADRRLARVVEYMSAHFAEPLRLERLAAEAGVSRFHFARLFRAATGESPHAHLVRLRMSAARQLLRDTTLTAAEVAAATGYASPAHFTRAFARHVGRTPTTFRAGVNGQPG